MQTMTLKFKALIIISSIVLTISLIGCNQRTCTTLQTCKICNSTRMIKSKYRMGFIPTITEVTIKFKSKDYSHGVHNWEDGISSAVINPVRDGTVVLVHKNKTYGAFILNKQDVDPEETSYTWHYRTDGMGIFDKKSTVIKTGSGREAQINFGPFSVAWSANTKGSGWIYYARQDGDPKKPEDLYICVTDKKSLEGIDASANTWIYKSARFDN